MSITLTTIERRAEIERLTYEIMDGGMVTDKENVKEFEIEDWVTVYAGNAVFRLAEYEDTGLTPEQVMELKERDTAKKIEINAGIPTCPVCGRRIVKCYDFCPDCGQRLEQ